MPCPWAKVDGAASGEGGLGGMMASACFLALSNCLVRAKCLLLSSFSAAEEKEAAVDVLALIECLTLALPLCLRGRVGSPRWRMTVVGHFEMLSGFNKQRADRSIGSEMYL